MIIYDRIEEDRVKIYSDLHVRILEVETGVICDDVTTSYPPIFTYEETEEPINE